MIDNSFSVSPDGPKIQTVHFHQVYIYIVHCSACEIEKSFYNFVEAKVWQKQHTDTSHGGHKMVCNHKLEYRITLKSPNTDNEYNICEKCARIIPFFSSFNK